MAESTETQGSAPAPAPAKVEKQRYRNRSKLDQTIYLSNGQSIRVPSGDTVLLDEETYHKFFNLFEPVEAGKKGRK